MEYPTAHPSSFGSHAPEPEHHQPMEVYGINSVETQPSFVPNYMPHVFNPFPTTWATQQQDSQNLSNAQDRPAESVGPSKKNRKRKALTLRADIWSPYKDRIIELHIQQNLPLPEVRDIMEKEFGFTAEERQYRTRISQWRLDKNVKTKEMEAIVRKRQRRKLVETDKPDLIFAVRGNIVEPKKINRWMKRNGIAESNIYAPCSAASTPSEVDHWTVSQRGSPVPSPTPSVRTPNLIMEFSPSISQWPGHSGSVPAPADSSGVSVRILSPSYSCASGMDNLPWFKFQKFLEALCTMTRDPPDRVHAEIPDIDADITGFHENQALDYAIYSPQFGSYMNFGIYNQGQADIPDIDLNLSGFYEDPVLSPAMYGPQFGPSSRIHRTMNISCEIVDSMETMLARWIAKGAIEDIQVINSNFQVIALQKRSIELLESVRDRLRPIGKETLLRFLNFATYLLSNNLLSDAQTDEIVQWISYSKIHSVLATLVSSKMPTVQAFSSNLLESALKAEDVDIARILLGAGVNANSRMPRSQVVPLQFAAEKGSADLVQMLLDAGAEVNAPPCHINQAYFSNFKYNKTALQAAACSGNIKVVQILLDAGAEINAPASSIGGRTALQAAAENGKFEIVQVLLRAGADVNASPAHTHGKMALQAAAGSRNVQLIRILLDAGANVNTPVSYNRWGGTPIQAAAKGGSVELVQVLLNAGADVNAPSGEDCMTALQEAAESGNIELTKVLLDAGANVNAPRAWPFGATALKAAVLNGHTKLIRILIDAGADVNASLGSTLPAAAYNGSLEIIHMLLAAGAHVDACDDYGGTALQAAAGEGNVVLVRALLNAGADVNAPLAWEATALQAAAWTGNAELVQILLDAGADVNVSAADKGGITVLQAACTTGNPELVRILVNAGAEVNAPPNVEYGRTALQAAAEKGNVEVVEILLHSGSNINAPPAAKEGVTALQAAACIGNARIVQVLLDAGANVNAPSAKEMGKNALQVVAIKGNIELTRILLDAGADVNAPPAWDGELGITSYRTALQAAAWNGRIELVQILLDAGADVNALPSCSAGKTALQAAAEKGYVEVVQALLVVGADVNAPFSSGVGGGSALRLAAGGGHIRIAHILLDAGADVNATCPWETAFEKCTGLYGTALEKAVDNGRIDMVQLLLDSGASIDSPRSTRFSRLLQLAAFRGHDAIITLLKEHQLRR